MRSLFCIMASTKTTDRTFDAGPWHISLRKSHILRSNCERRLEDGCHVEEENDICLVCK